MRQDAPSAMALSVLTALFAILEPISNTPLKMVSSATSESVKPKQIQLGMLICP